MEHDQCVDAETLAAWAEGALPANEAARIERHVSDCDRCLAMAATFARTEPAVPAAEPWWRRWQVRWLVPVATAATAAALWVAAPRDRQPELKAPMPVESPATTAVRPAVPNPAARQEPPPPIVSPALQPKGQAGSKPVEKRDSAADATGLPARDRSIAEPAPLAAPVGANAARPATPPAKPEGLAESVTAAAEAPVATFRSATAVAEIASPDGSQRWRIVSAQRVERAAVKGEAWQVVPLPAHAGIVAGHSPTASVLWLVGRRGTVLITTDGSRFSPVAFLEPVDLIRVQAASARDAVVTTDDGRRFRTTDGGVTWNRQ